MQQTGPTTNSISPEQLKELDAKEDRFVETFTTVAQDMFSGNFPWALTEQNEPVIRKMIQYFLRSPRFFEPKGRRGNAWHDVRMSSKLSFGKGICLIGNPRTGKDTIFMVFAHILKHWNHEDAYQMVNCQQIAQQYERKGIGETEKYGYESFKRGPKGLLMDHPIHYCFRDLGVERDVSHYGNRTSVMVDILQARNDHHYTGIKSFATTNMGESEVAMRYGAGLPPTGREITQEMLDQGGNARVIGRFCQMFNRIILPGQGHEM